MTQQPLEVKRELFEIRTSVKKEKNYYGFDFYGLSQRIDILAIIYTRGVEFLTDSNNRAPPPPPPPRCERSKWRDRSWQSCKVYSSPPEKAIPIFSKKEDRLFILPVSTLNFTARPSRWTTFLFFQSSSWILGWLANVGLPVTTVTVMEKTIKKRERESTPLGKMQKKERKREAIKKKGGWNGDELASVVSPANCRVIMNQG